MAENKENKENKDENKIDISQSGLEKLLAKSLQNFQEERDLALERYRRQDENIQTSDDFILQGKFNVDYLRTAADRSNAIFNLAKLYKEIIFRDDNKGVDGGNAVGVGDAQKREILNMLKEMKKQ